MALTRSRKLNRALFRNSNFSKINHLYTIRNTHYGRFCDSIEYNTVKATFKQVRDNYTKTQKGKKSDRSLWRAREKIYQLVEGNLGRDGRKPIFFTLTQKDQETNLRISNAKIKALMRRLKVFLGYSPKYLIVPEFHKSGAIHYHGVFFNLPYIHVKKFRHDLWKQGYVDLQLPKKIKSVARYLAKYLTKDTLVNLPKNEKTYFCSRDLIRPVLHYTDSKPQDIIEVLEAVKLVNGIKIKYICNYKN